MTDPASMERRLDVGALSPPEPMHRILAALDQLDAGQFLRVEHRRQPWPLLAALEELGYAYHMYTGADRVVILIWKLDDPGAAAAAGARVRELD